MASNGSLRNVSGSQGLPKYGLILKGKKESSAPSTSSTTSGTKFTLGKKLNRASAFGDDSDSDNDESQQDEAISSFSSRSGARGRTLEQKRVNMELRAVQAQKSKLAEEEQRKALEEDPNVFDYDGIYDDLKKAELEKKKSMDNPDGGVVKKPRYMAALIKASAQRKIDLERAELRKIQREREEEGEQFGDKEKFVTGAYKRQMEELKRIEEEEKRREAMERDVTKGGDMTNFYRDILNQTDRDFVLPKPKEDKEKAESKSEDEEEQEDERTKSLRQKAIRKGLIQLNDSEEIVDKRQLLSGGLNLTSRTVKKEAKIREEREREAKQFAARKAAEEKAKYMERKAAKEQQARARELVLQQQKEKEEEDRKRKQREEEELKSKMARQTTDEAVSDARARYLARKKAQAQKKEEDLD